MLQHKERKGFGIKWIIYICHRALKCIALDAYTNDNLPSKQQAINRLPNEIKTT